MSKTFEIIDINTDNLEKEGFFCYMSKRKAPGYQQKRDWLEERFGEGLKLKIIHEIGGRKTGFIEYVPGEYAWRAVHAPDYIFIHCLWVVGKGKGKGYAAQLIQTCLEDARAQGKLGVVMVASDRVWLVGKEIFLHHGFEMVDESVPFQLLVKRFKNGPNPSFPVNWEERQAAFGPGLTVLRTPQCPYIEDAVNGCAEVAGELGIPFKTIEFLTAAEVQERAPSPFGIFSIVKDGKLLSYYYLLPKDLRKRLTENS
jgi:GNAT superfamily N-acetyltransferase